MRRRFALDLQDVTTLASAALAEAERQGFAISIAVVDDGGYPLHLTRMDGAKATTADVAIRKARTAALSRTATSAMEDRLGAMPSMFFLDTLPMGGGLPVMHEGDCVGGIGVSGLTPAQDEAIAADALAALAGAKVDG